MAVTGSSRSGVGVRAHADMLWSARRTRTPSGTAVKARGIPWRSVVQSQFAGDQAHHGGGVNHPLSRTPRRASGKQIGGDVHPPLGVHDPGADDEKVVQGPRRCECGA